MPRRVVAALLGALLALSCGEADRPVGSTPRIVSLVPSATETLFALGAGDLVVGRSAYCDYPPEALGIPAVGDAVSVRVERVLALRPTLVLVGSAAQREALLPLGGRVVVRDVAPRSVPAVMQTIAMLAELCGREDEGEGILREIDVAVRGALERQRGAPRHVVFVAQKEPLVVAGGGSYVDDLITAVGALNVAGDIDEEWPTLSLETLVARDPEVILDSRLGEDAPEGDSTERWADLATVTAVRTGRVRAVTDPVLVRAGPRVPEALALLRSLVWEEPR